MKAVDLMQQQGAQGAILVYADATGDPRVRQVGCLTGHGGKVLVRGMARAAWQGLVGWGIDAAAPCILVEP